MIRPATCPICEKPIVRPDGTTSDSAPFCSPRCQQVDLYRWFSGKYAIVESLPPERLAEEMFKDEERNAGGEGLM